MFLPAELLPTSLDDSILDHSSVLPRPAGSAQLLAVGLQSAVFIAQLNGIAFHAFLFKIHFCTRAG